MSEPTDPALALWALADAEEASRLSQGRTNGETDLNPRSATSSNLEASPSTIVSASTPLLEHATTGTVPQSTPNASQATTSPVNPTIQGTFGAAPGAQVHDDDDSSVDDGDRELRALQTYFGSNAIFNNANFPAMRPTSVDNEKKNKKSVLERAAHLPRSQMHTAVGCCARSGRLHRFFYSLLVAFWILFIYIIPGTVLFLVVTVLGMVPNLALVAADGAVALVIGNVILRAANLAHYVDPGKAAAIGATGAILSTLCIGAAFFWLPRDEKNRPPKIIAFPLVVLMTTLAGVIGTSLLQKHGVDLGDTDVLHAARAGALGGVIIAPLMITIGPLLIVAIGILLTPLWIAMAAGLKWVWGRTNETWNGRWSRSSYCYTYGRCGADPEIDDEVEQFEAFAASRNVMNRQPAWNSMHMDTFGGSMA